MILVMYAPNNRTYLGISDDNQIHPCSLRNRVLEEYSLACLLQNVRESKVDTLTISISQVFMSNNSWKTT